MLSSFAERRQGGRIAPDMLADVTVTQQVAFVMKDGKVYKR